MTKYKLTIVLFISLLSETVVADSEPGGFVVVPALELAFKHNEYSIPAVDVDLKFSAAFTSLVPSLTLTYGRIYGLINRDLAITQSEKYLYGTQANPGFNSIDYSRADTTLAFGYRLVSTFNLFAGYTQGKASMLLSSIDGSGTAFATTRIYTEQGYYLGTSYSYLFASKASLNLGAAMGQWDGLLKAGTDSEADSIRSTAPGYSVNLVWVQPASTALSYRIGVKYTAYRFTGDEFRVDGVRMPIPRSFNYYERISTLYVGLSHYF